MKNECNDDIYVSCCEEIINTAYEDTPLVDPLAGTNNSLEPIYYRVDKTVFAEPINLGLDKKSAINSDTTEENNDEDLVFMDNVIVQKRKGKRNKYHIDFKEDKNICPQQNCGKRFHSLTLLKAHIRRVHCADRARCVCEHCGASFPAQYLLRRHLSTHGDQRVQCAVCCEMLSERTDMRVHLRSHAGTRKYECNICGKKFTRSSVLTTHVKFVHREGDLPCDKCGQSFSSRTEWSRHMNAHNSKDPESISAVKSD